MHIFIHFFFLGNLAANSLFSGALTYSTGWNEESCAVKA
jgi:hypothetical protein